MKRRRRKKNVLYPEPGAWIHDMPAGLPKIEQPEPLDLGKPITTAKVREYVSYEGLGFCIYEYLPAGKIVDKRLARLWAEAKVALRRIVSHLD